MSHFNPPNAEKKRSIAAIDKTVRPQEIKKLYQDIQKKWLPMEGSTDDFGSDAAHLISISFEYLMDEMAAPEDTWQNFKSFFHDNPHLFTPEVKYKIFKTANDIVNSFSGANKSELTILAELGMLFENEFKHKLNSI